MTARMLLALFTLGSLSPANSIIQFNDGVRLQKHDPFTDIGGAVGKAFEVVCDPHEVCGARDGARIGHHNHQELSENLVIELIHLRIARGERALTRGGGYAERRGRVD